MKKRKNILKFALAVLILGVSTNTVAHAYSILTYSGTVQKYSDFESGVLKKTNESEQATNRARSKPEGAYECWVEVSGTGSNATYKTAYTSTGTYYMNYKQNLDSPNTCAGNLYRSKTNLKLNISTALVNFNGGTVSGSWSPDTV